MSVLVPVAVSVLVTGAVSVLVPVAVPVAVSVLVPGAVSVLVPVAVSVLVPVAVSVLVPVAVSGLVPEAVPCHRPRSCVVSVLVIVLCLCPKARKIGYSRNSSPFLAAPAAAKSNRVSLISELPGKPSSAHFLRFLI